MDCIKSIRRLQHLDGKHTHATPEGTECWRIRCPICDGGKKKKRNAFLYVNKFNGTFWSRCCNEKTTYLEFLSKYERSEYLSIATNGDTDFPLLT